MTDNEPLPFADEEALDDDGDKASLCIQVDS